MKPQKVMNLKTIAAAYGVDYRTFQNDMIKYKNLYNELDKAHFDGRKFYPIHQQIIEKYFGAMPD